MSALQWLQVAQIVLTAAAVVLLFTTRSGYRMGSWSTDLVGKIAMLESKVLSLNQRMDHAGDKVSDLATEVQGHPQTLRAFFLSVDYEKLADEKMRGIHVAHASLDARITAIERELREASKRGENRAV